MKTITRLFFIVIAISFATGCKASTVPAPTPSVSPEQQLFKAYSRQNYSIEYPSAWEVQQTQDRVTFKAPGSAMVSVTESQAVSGLSASTFESSAADAIERAISATGAKAVCLFKGVKTVGDYETYNIQIETEDNDGKTIEIEQYYFFREKVITLIEFYNIKGAKPPGFSEILASYREK